MNQRCVGVKKCWWGGEWAVIGLITRRREKCATWGKGCNCCGAFGLEGLGEGVVGGGGNRTYRTNRTDMGWAIEGVRVGGVAQIGRSAFPGAGGGLRWKVGFELSRSQEWLRHLLEGGRGR